MSYYVQLSANIKSNFGSGADKNAIIASLRNEGISKSKDFSDLDLQRKGTRIFFDSAYTFLLGTDKDSRNNLVDDLLTFFGDVDDIGLRVPKLKEWLACVTLIDTDNKKAPKFQVVALVGLSALQKAAVNWSNEEKPPQLWATHVEAQDPPAVKMMRDVKAFTGRGWW